MTAHDLGPSYPGTVVLDIGGQTGALIVYAEPHHHGQEFDLLPVAGGPSTHAAVRPRVLGSHTVYCAVYPGLPTGAYRLQHPDREILVRVDSGAVTEVRRQESSQVSVDALHAYPSDTNRASQAR